MASLNVVMKMKRSEHCVLHEIMIEMEIVIIIVRYFCYCSRLGLPCSNCNPKCKRDTTRSSGYASGTFTTHPENEGENV